MTCTNNHRAGARHTRWTTWSEASPRFGAPTSNECTPRGAMESSVPPVVALVISVERGPPWVQEPTSEATMTPSSLRAERRGLAQ